MVMKRHFRRGGGFPALGALVACLALALLPGCDRAASTGAKPSDVLARAGADVITYGEFQDALKRLLPDDDDEAAEAEGVSAEELEELKRSLLNQLIEESLILQEARKAGIDVSDEEVLKEAGALQEDFEDEKFRDAVIARYGTMEKWRGELRKKLVIRRTVDSLVNSTVEVTAEEALEYYNENRKDYEMPEQVHARMIVVPTEEEAKKARKMAFAGNFEDVARELSTGPEAADGGDLGFFGRGDMPLEFEETVFSLQPGRISNIVKTDYGYHIFKVVEKTKGRKLTFKDVKVSITEMLMRERSEQLYRDWVTSLKKNAQIEIKTELIGA